MKEELVKDDMQLEPGTVVVGVIVGFKGNTRPKVSFPGCPREQGIVARTTVQLESSDIGRNIALLFESGNCMKPLIVGKIQSFACKDYEESRDAVVDGERLELSAEKEIVLSCGKASITLTRAGKIILRGEYVLSRSAGANRIKGATVHIN